MMAAGGVRVVICAAVRTIGSEEAASCWPRAKVAPPTWAILTAWFPEIVTATAVELEPVLARDTWMGVPDVPISVPVEFRRFIWTALAIVRRCAPWFPETRLATESLYTPPEEVKVDVPAVNAAPSVVPPTDIEPVIGRGLVVLTVVHIFDPFIYSSALPIGCVGGVPPSVY